MRFVWASRTHPGLVRGQNEDSLWPRANGDGVARGEADDSFLAVVADGMGGHVGGEIASRLAVEAAVAAEGDAVARVHAANHAVVARALDQPRLAGMGTTMTLAVFTGPVLQIGHIGDSRAYLYRGGDLVQLTRDHSLVADMIASGELSPQEAAVHPFRSVITRALGMESKVAVDRVERQLEPGDRVILCSDGLTSMLATDEIVALLKGTPRTTVGALVDAANRAGGVDNTSVIVVDARR
jgi:serine/threonine protein phosphatase PrpC